MTTNNNPEMLMEEILLRVKEIENLEKEIEAKKLEIDGVISPLMKQHPDFVLMLSTKTGYKGTFYSIRSRFNPELKRKVSYICGSNVPFGSWLKKANKNGKNDGAVSNNTSENETGDETP